MSPAAGSRKDDRGKLRLRGLGSLVENPSSPPVHTIGSTSRILSVAIAWRSACLRLRLSPQTQWYGRSRVLFRRDRLCYRGRLSLRNLRESRLSCLILFQRLAWNDLVLGRCSFRGRSGCFSDDGGRE